jgi:hypothetical protein
MSATQIAREACLSALAKAIKEALQRHERGYVALHSSACIHKDVFCCRDAMLDQLLGMVRCALVVGRDSGARATQPEIDEFFFGTAPGWGGVSVVSSLGMGRVGAFESHLNHIGQPFTRQKLGPPGNPAR